MEETKAAANNEIPLEENPLYLAVLKEMAGEDEAYTVEKLKLLAELYPQERVVRDLLVRTQLRASLSKTVEVPVEHSQPAPFLRRVLVVLFIVAAGLVAITLFTSAYNTYIYGPLQLTRAAGEIDAAKIGGIQLKEKGGLREARETLEWVATKVPGDPTIEAALIEIDDEERLAQVYDEAVAAQARDDVQEALRLFRQIFAEEPTYLDVQERIDRLQKLETLAGEWQAAQDAAQVRDWRTVIDKLEWIQREDSTYLSADVKRLLFEAYSQLALQLRDQANGDLDTLRQAIGYWEKALKLEPTEQVLIQEKNLATDFIAGAEAFARGDWADAVSHWEAVYTIRPDYQSGDLKARLAQLYPQAARQLIDRAGGSERDLRLALDYLEKALQIQPDNQALQEESRLVKEYLQGAEAFAQENWNGAIAHWRPVFDVRRDYQNGLLEELLRQACTNSANPTEGLCPP